MIATAEGWCRESSGPWHLTQNSRIRARSVLCILVLATVSRPLHALERVVWNLPGHHVGQWCFHKVPQRFCSHQTVLKRQDAVYVNSSARSRRSTCRRQCQFRPRPHAIDAGPALVRVEVVATVISQMFVWRHTWMTFQPSTSAHASMSRFVSQKHFVRSSPHGGSDIQAHTPTQERVSCRLLRNVHPSVVVSFGAFSTTQSVCLQNWCVFGERAVARPCSANLSISQCLSVRAPHRRKYPSTEYLCRINSWKKLLTGQNALSICQSLPCLIFSFIFSSLSFSLVFSVSLCLSLSLSLSLSLFVWCCGVSWCVMLCHVVLLCCVLCCVVVCGVCGVRCAVCGVRCAVCGVRCVTLKTPPCAHSKRPSVCWHHAHMCFSMCAWCQYTQGAF